MAITTVGALPSAHTNGAWALTSLGDDRFVTGGADGELKLWRTTPATIAPTPAADQADDQVAARDAAPVTLLAEVPNAHRLSVIHADAAAATTTTTQCLATSAFDGLIRLWQFPDASLDSRLEIKTTGLEAFHVAVSPDGQWVASGGDTTTAAASGARTARAATLWSTDTGDKAQQLDVSATSTTVSFVTCLRFLHQADDHPSMRRLACGGNDGSVLVFDCETGTLESHLTAAAASRLPIRALHQPPAEPTLLLGAAEDECVHLLDWRCREPVGTLSSGGSGALYAVTSTPQHPLLVFAGGADARVRAYDRRTGECVHVCSEHRGTVWGMATVPTRPVRVVSTGDDGALVVMEP